MKKSKKSSNKLFGIDRMIVVSVGVALIVGFFLGAQFMNNKGINPQKKSLNLGDATLKTYTNEKFKFQFQYPQEYIVNVNESQGGITSFNILKEQDEENSMSISIDVGSPLIERSDYYYGGMKWTTDIIDTLKDLEVGAVFDGVKEDATKISNIDIGGFQGVKYTAVPMEGIKSINVALMNDDLTLLVTGTNKSTQQGIDADFDMEVFDEIVRTLMVLKK